MGLRQLPTYVMPRVPRQVKMLNRETLIPEITKFATGGFDIRSPQFQGLTDIMNAQTKREQDSLINKILAVQGRQRQRGGAAVAQLAEQLRQLQLENLENERMLGYDIAKTNIGTRLAGINAGQGTVRGAQQYALGSAQLANNFNNSLYNMALQRRQIRKSEANTFGNIGMPILGGLAQMGTTLATPFVQAKAFEPLFKQTRGTGLFSAGLGNPMFIGGGMR